MGQNPTTSFLAPFTSISGSMHGNNTTNNFILNASAAAPLPVWGRASISLATIAVLGALLNGTILLVFLRERALRTSFTLHVMHLLLLNLLCCIFQYSLGAVVNLNASASRRWYLDDGLCDLYLLTLCLLNAGISNIHGLMAINRAWAIIHPLSYRNRNSKRLTVQLGAAMWVYLLLMMFPYWLLDELHYRQAPTTRQACQFNSLAMSAYSPLAALLVYTAPIMVVLLSFAVVIVDRVVRNGRQKARRSANVIGILPAVGHTNVGCVTAATISATVGGGALEPFPSALAAGQEAVWRPVHSHKYLVLALLTASATVCYMPRTVYILVNMCLPEYGAPTYYEVASILYSCELVVDPILFTLTLDQLREALKRRLCRPQRC